MKKLIELEENSPFKVAWEKLKMEECYESLLNQMKTDPSDPYPLFHAMIFGFNKGLEYGVERFERKLNGQ